MASERAFKVWVCPKCGCMGRKTHEHFGRCLTPEEVAQQKVRMETVDQMVSVLRQRAGR